MTDFSLRIARAEAAERVLIASEWEVEHARQVERLACWLFSALREFHGFGPDEEILLRTAALLHDVGYPVDPPRHHKVSARIIRAHLGPPFAAAQVELIGMLARYHRKALPKLRHRRYSNLGLHERRLVIWLAGILRVADGLDRGHDSAVQWLNASIADRRLEIRVGAYTRRDTQSADHLAPSNGVLVISNGDRCVQDFPSLAVSVTGGIRKRSLLERAMGMPVLIRAD